MNQDDPNNQVDQPNDQPTDQDQNGDLEESVRTRKTKVVKVITEAKGSDEEKLAGYTRSGSTNNTKWLTEGIKNHEHNIPGWI
jgi:hypothetical protein